MTESESRLNIVAAACRLMLNLARSGSSAFTSERGQLEGQGSPKGAGNRKKKFVSHLFTNIE